MASGIYFPIAALGFSLLTIITFYVKKPIKSVETKIYKALMVSNFFGLILELSCTFASYIHKELPLLSDFILKTYLVYNLLWTLILTIYVLYISVDLSTLKRLNNKLKTLIVVIFLVSCYLIYSLDCILVIKDNFRIRYTEGPGVNFTYAVCGILIFIIVFLMLGNRKNLKNKRYIPVFIFLVAIVAGIIIQKSNPGLLIMTYVETLTVAIMYHTIENPDMKLLKEMHEAKEISDNANEEKTLFLYNMTQEIRTTTKNIDNEADNIIDSDDIEFDRESARNIKGETSKFRMMTNDILDVSAIDSANIKIYNSSYNLKILLRSIIGSYTEVCNNKNLEFRTNIEHNIPESLYGDNISLKRAINLLLTYSVKCTKKGYVELDINTIKKGDVVRLIITIEDSSMGIKSSELEKIKIDNKNISECYKLVILMNGTMVITSNYGIGNKIKIILDQKIDKDINKEEKKYQEILDNKKILVVDNNESSIKVIDKLLKGSKIEMDYSLNGKDAYNKIKTRNRYDLILIDEELNMMTGAELLKYLKEIRNFNIPVILLSKDNKYEYNEEYLKMGFNDILIKPIKKEVLIEKINKNIMNRVDILDKDKK